MHADSRIGPSLTALVLVVLLLAGSAVEAFYIPGWSIKSYRDDAPIPLFVNKVYSDNTQLQYAYYDLPFVCPPSGRPHADSSLVSGHSISLNLGEVLRGDRIRSSDYDLHMGKDEECRFLCRQELDRAGLKRARELVAKGYVAEWIVDNLPGATTFVTVDKTRKYYAAGFKIGAKDFSPADGKARHFIHNHATIVLRWRKAPGKDGEAGRKVIVGFEVYPKSVGTADRDAEGCPNRLHDANDGLELRLPSNATDRPRRYPSSSYDPYAEDGEDDDVEDGATLQIPYTYSVYFREEDKVEWASRWDLYFVNDEGSSTIHWLAILNSLIILGVLTTVVAVILARTVRSDIRSYSSSSSSKDGLEDGKSRLKRTKRSSSRRQSPRGLEKPLSSGLLDQHGGGGGGGGGDGEQEAELSSDEEESLEDVTGWKLLHGDVFRAPPYGGLLAPLVGSGVQLVAMAAGLVLLSCVGVLNPSFRGGFVSVGAALFIAAGVFSGYFSGRIYRTFGGQQHQHQHQHQQQWRQNALLTALLFPGLLFALLMILNLFVWAQASSTAIPFGTIVALAAAWLGLQLPLVHVGAWYGHVRVGAWDHPTKTQLVPRPIPPRPAWYVRPLASLLLAGLLPFAVVFIELLFVFKSLWQDKSGYYYVFGFLAAVSLILVLTVTEVTIVATYMQLCAENHNWWWQSFLVGGGSAVWIFLYSTWYYLTRLHIQGFVSGMLFFGYSLLACAVYGLLTGTIGFLAAYAFVRRIYGAIKAD